MTRKLEIKQTKTQDDIVHVKGWDSLEKTDDGLFFLYYFFSPLDIFSYTFAVICPLCKHTRASFIHVERTVGEKPITFYRCESVECRNKWSKK